MLFASFLTVQYIHFQNAFSPRAHVCNRLVKILFWKCLLRTRNCQTSSTKPPRCNGDISPRKRTATEYENSLALLQMNLRHSGCWPLWGRAVLKSRRTRPTATTCLEAEDISAAVASPSPVMMGSKIENCVCWRGSVLMENCVKWQTLVRANSGKIVWLLTLVCFCTL